MSELTVPEGYVLTPSGKRFFIIAAGIPARTCQRCPATVYWISHPSSGRGHPVSVADAEALAPTATEPGRGISHFADCPEAEYFRKKK